MWLWPPIKRGPILGCGLGLLMGGMEAVGLAATAPISLDLAAGLGWGLSSVLAGGLLGFVAGLLGGITAEWVLRAPELPARHAVAMGGAGFFLAGFHLWSMALVKLGQGLPIPAAALAATPIGVAGVVYFNAHYWLRREELGEERRVGFLVGAVGLSLCLGLGAGAWLSAQEQGNRNALDVDPHVLVITVEGLRMDDLSAFSGSSAASTPRIDALAAEGIRFHEAISPVPESAPMHVGLFTGRHPARLGVWSDEHALGRVWPYLPDQLRREGYATGAFVSTLAVGTHTGLARGFGVYDDDRYPEWLPAGLGRIRLMQRVEDGLRRTVPDLSGWPRLYARPDGETVHRATTWMRRHHDRPQLAWIHLSALEGLTGPARHTALAGLDAQVDALLAASDGEGSSRPRMVVLMGVGAGDSARDGVSEARVRVPLLIVPKKMRVYEPDVRLAVRSMDVCATILARLGLKPFEQVDGADLTGFAQNTKTRGYATLLASRIAATPEPIVELGYRAGQAGTTSMIKLVMQPATDKVAFFDLGTDPAERTNLAEEQVDAVAELRSHTLGEASDAKAGQYPPGAADSGLVRMLRHHRFGP